MSFPKHTEYKESGAEWLGKVPAHWDMPPCRAIVIERSDRNENGDCEDYLSLMANIGVIPYADKGDVGNKKPEDLSKCKMVHEGDFVINSMNYYIGSYGISPYHGVCSPVYIVLTPRNEVVDSRFAFRIFEDNRFQEYAQSFGNGILEHRRSINWDILKTIPVPVPPPDEQKAISSFLDVETSKIDGLVSEQRRLIELLKEKRQAVISHAVTKGLNPNAPMKPSGIQWLGDVPQHWDMTRLKYLVITDRGIQMGPFGGMLKELEETPTLFKLYGQQNTINDNFEVGSRWLSEERFTALREYELLPHDVVLTRKGASIGHCRLVPENIQKGVIDSDTIRVRLDLEQLTVAFAVLLMHEGYLEKEILNKQKGSVLPGLNTGTIANLRIALPTIEEQKDICDYTEHFGGQILSLIAEAERAIELLQERRTALISAAVTGKIDVREFACQETA